MAGTASDLPPAPPRRRRWLRLALAAVLSTALLIGTGPAPALAELAAPAGSAEATPDKPEFGADQKPTPPSPPGKQPSQPPARTDKPAEPPVGVAGPPAGPSPTGTAPQPGGSTGAVAPAQESAEVTADRARALAAAQRSRQPTLVDTLTSETSRTVANADGTFTTTTHTLPVRVRQAGAWTDLKATLRKNADGAISPTASLGKVTLSGGGTTALATLTDSDGAEVSFTFPKALPAPTLADDTATYTDVYPGVDLQSRVNQFGEFSHLLIVNNATAAANTDLATLRLATTTKGLTISADASGNLTAADASGTPRFHASAPRMWDAGPPAAPSTARGGSATDAEPGAEPDPNAPAPGARVAPLGVQVSAGELTLTPDQKLLTGPGVRYPVIIDPTWTKPQIGNHWTEVKEEWPTATNYDSKNMNEAPGVGYCQFAGQCNGGRYRSYFNVPLDRAIWDGYNISAFLHTAQVFASYKNSTNPIEVRHSGPFNAATNWRNQPCAADNSKCPHIGTVAVGPGNRGDIRYDVTKAIEWAASSHWPSWTFAMAAQDERQKLAHQRFAVNPYIDILYDKRPNVPTKLSTSPPIVGTGCNNTAATMGYIGATPGGAITLTATVSSPTGHNVRARFRLVDVDNGNEVLLNGTFGNTVPSGATSSLVANRFTNNHRYYFYVASDDGKQASPETGPCWFVIRSNPVMPGENHTNPMPWGPRANPRDAGCDQNGNYGSISAASTGIHLITGVWSYANDQPVRSHFRLFDTTAGGMLVNELTTAPVHPPGNTGVWTSVNVGQLADGHDYAWDVRAEGPYNNGHTVDGYNTSHWTALCHFRIDRTPPGAPTITSAEFPTTGTIPGTSKHVGDTGCFVFQSHDTDVKQFAYRVHGDPTDHWINATNGSASACNVKPARWGINYVHAWTYDHAGNGSSSTQYKFYLPDNPSAVPVPGDLSGDGIPDLLIADRNGDLRLYPTGVDPDYGGIIAATKSRKSGRYKLGRLSDQSPWVGSRPTRRRSVRPQARRQ